MQSTLLQPHDLIARKERDSLTAGDELPKFVHDPIRHVELLSAVGLFLLLPVAERIQLFLIRLVILLLYMACLYICTSKTRARLTSR